MRRVNVLITDGVNAGGEMLRELSVSYGASSRLKQS